MSFPIWVGARAFLKPTLAWWPLTKSGMRHLHLIDALASHAPKPASVVLERMIAGGPAR